MSIKPRWIAPVAVALAVAVPWTAAADNERANLATAPVTVIASGEATSFDGVVEAVRQTVLASQVVGSVVALEARAGGRVKAGQLLVRLDARAAEQQAGAAAAQVQAARAAQEAATRELERQRQLFQKSYISQAALDRAEAQFKAAQAGAAAQLASAGADSSAPVPPGRQPRRALRPEAHCRSRCAPRRSAAPRR